MSFLIADDRLRQLGTEILSAVWANFPRLARNQIALTWLVYDPPVIVNTGGALSSTEFWKYSVPSFSYRGVERIYPASIVKLFYLVAVHEWLQGSMVQSSVELERAMRDMIVDSSNDATSYIVDVLSGTTSGPELPAGPFATWQYQRNIVNRYYQSLGWPELESVNVNQKPWNDGPYGRERAFLGEMMENRNMLTTDAVARLLHSIIGGVAVSAVRSQQMMGLLQRSLNPADWPDNGEGEENQITGFFAEGLPKEAKVWSKAGWTSQVRHDAAYIELSDRQPFLLVAFTEGKNRDRRHLLPFLSQAFIAAMGQL
ncbi:MAG: serine hydrolase [Chloroflexaceae bacterium]|nr:serine hydrolase [Chloroflexaceae bacterium]